MSLYCNIENAYNNFDDIDKLAREVNENRKKLTNDVKNDFITDKKKIYDTIENLKKLDGYELFDKNDYSNYDGTLIKNLINDNNDNESIDSSLKSASSDETYNDNYSNNKSDDNYSDDYSIKLNSIESDNIDCNMIENGNFSSDNSSKIISHINKCKKCKNKFFNTLKNKKKIKNSESKKKKEKNFIETFKNENENNEINEIKEFIIIIFLCLLIIFIVDTVIRSIID